MNKETKTIITAISSGVTIGLISFICFVYIPHNETDAHDVHLSPLQSKLEEKEIKELNPTEINEIKETISKSMDLPIKNIQANNDELIVEFHQNPGSSLETEQDYQAIKKQLIREINPGQNKEMTRLSMDEAELVKQLKSDILISGNLAD